MVTVLQTLFALALILLIIMLVFRPRRTQVIAWPENYRDYLLDYVRFYANLDDADKSLFDDRFQKFLAAVQITGAGAEVEDLDRVLIGAAAVIPVFYIPDWQYINLKEVLLYPGNFNMDFEQQGPDRMISGMVGTGALQDKLIISKWELRQGFISTSNHNTAIHEFVHLIDKMDGTLDGVPELLLERKYVAKWQQLLQSTMDEIRHGISDINPYAATSPVECFAVVSEYFFENPHELQAHHPHLHEMLQRIYIRS